MILGLGLDICQVSRVESFVARWGERFARKVCCESERAALSRYSNPKSLAQNLAGRVAAKEAACKALGTGMSGGVGWHCFEIVHEKSGRPTLRCNGQAARLMSQIGVKNVLLSISHDAGVAVAVVIFEGEN